MMITPNEYFDEIYCINLTSCTDRWQTVNERFKRENIHVKRIHGIDGNLLENDFKKHKSVKSSRIKSVGRYAIWRTFSNLFQHIIDTDMKHILIFEDDILFHKDFSYYFDYSVKNCLPDNWDMWYLGSTQVTWEGVKVDNFLYQPNGNTYGCFAIAFNVDYLKRWYVEYKKGILNNDHFWAMASNRENVYISYPKLVSHSYGYSYNAKYEITDYIAEKLPHFKYDKNYYF